MTGQITFNSHTASRGPLVAQSSATSKLTIVEAEKHLRSVHLQDDIALMFTAIITQATSLPSLSNPDCAVLICKGIDHSIGMLVDCTTYTVEALDVKEKSTEKALFAAAQSHIETSTKKKESEKKLGELKTTLAGLNVKQDQFQEAITKLSTDVKNLQEKIENEKVVRFDAAIDWIPFVGLIGGLVTGRTERIIPFYSVFKGIASQIARDQEMLEQQLQSKTREMNTLKAEVQGVTASFVNQQSLVNGLNAEVSRTQTETEKIDKKRKELGTQLTIARNLLLELKKIQNSCQFLRWDTKTIIDLGIDEGLIGNFLQMLESVQTSFLQWRSSVLQLKY